MTYALVLSGTITPLTRETSALIRLTIRALSTTEGT